MPGYASFTKIFSGHVDQNGQPHIADHEEFDLYCLQLRGKRFNLTIEEYKDLRTNPQNRYYFGVVVPLAADYCGYEKEEMHEAFKLLFLRKPEEEGKPATVRSTAKLTIEEFTDFVDRCIRWCGEQGIVVPAPGEIKINEAE